MLEMIRGRRLAFVGDSLNRNMWESLVCILKGSVKDKSQVFEAHGRHQFRWEAEYSFVFKVGLQSKSVSLVVVSRDLICVWLIGL